MVLLATGSTRHLVASASRPLIGTHSVLRQTRHEQAVAHATAARAAYVEAVAVTRASGCRTVGLALGPNDQEYILWRLLDDPGPRPRIDHLRSVGLTSRPSPGTSREPPCAIIADEAVGVGRVAAGAVRYRLLWSEGTVKVLLRASQPAGQSIAAGTVPWARVTADQRELRPGDRLVVGIDVGNPTTQPPADLLVGIRLPDGRSAVFVTGYGMSAAMPFEPGRALPVALVAPPGFALQDRAFLDLDLPMENIPEGTYRAFAMLVRREGRAAGRIDPADVLAEDALTITIRR
jgi:hypothetical protein